MNLNRQINAGIIPDGNRRWAIANSVELNDAYRLAMKKIVESLEIFYTMKFDSVSVFLLSKDNLLRQREDLGAVYEAEIYLLQELLPNLIHQFDLKVFHAGNMEPLPNEYKKALRQVCLDGNGVAMGYPRLYLCANYDPWSELNLNISEISDSSCFKLENLWVPLEIDLVIRTGGDYRISGFLPLQCKYAELFFEQYMFPDITQDRIREICSEFLNRKRRFGK